MGKTLLYRLFGAGKIPGKYAEQIRSEGRVMSDEGLPGSVTFRNFRGPGRRSRFRRTWFSGSIVLTNQHFLAFQYSRPIIGVPWRDPRIEKLRCTLDDDHNLCVAFEASTFDERCSGGMEVRYTTSLATSLLQNIRRLSREE